MKLILNNFYRFDIEQVAKKFGEVVKFCGTFTVKNEYRPVAIFKMKNPDRKKGHKKFLSLQLLENGDGLIRGFEAKDLAQYRFQSGLHCNKCDEVIYSSFRHLMVHCTCGECSVDGGREYLRVSGKDYNIVKIDHLTGKIYKNIKRTVPKKKRKTKSKKSVN